MTRVLSRLGTAALIALVLGFFVLLVLVPARAEPRASSALSSRPDGARALFLTAQALGLPVSTWSSAPGRLGGAGTLLVLPELPESPEHLPDASAGEHGAAPRHGRDLAHYRRFVEEGGTLLLLAESAEPLAFLCEAGLPGCDALSFFPFLVFDGATRVLFAGGAELAVVDGPSGRIEGPDLDVWLRTERGAAAGVSLRAGAGRVALLAMARNAFSNESLEETAEPALVFVRAVEELGPFERILFDEYALGGWTPPSLVSLAFEPRFAWLSAHLLLLVLVLGWRSTWSGPFPRDPEPLLAASPLARAQGFARTLARAGRWDLLARLLRRGLLERWSLRAGVRAPEFDALGVSEPDALAQCLRRLARGDEALLQRLEAAAESAAADEAGFERAAAELAGVEAALFPAERGKKPLQRGPTAATTGS